MSKARMDWLPSRSGTLHAVAPDALFGLCGMPTWTPLRAAVYAPRCRNCIRITESTAPRRSPEKKAKVRK